MAINKTEVKESMYSLILLASAKNMSERRKSGYQLHRGFGVYRFLGPSPADMPHLPWGSSI
jgi:hypothetical protein